MTKRVLIVDDSFFVRKTFQDIIKKSPELEVAETAKDGREALEVLDENASIDVVTLDIEMPRLDGLETLRELQNRGIDVPVLVVSSLTTKGAKQTNQAFRRGAADVIPKPSSNTSDLSQIEEKLVETLHAVTSEHTRSRNTRTSPPNSKETATTSQKEVTLASKLERIRPKIMLIGGSTGAPPVLRNIIGSLSRDFPIPVVVVQHISEPFLTGLCDGLGDLADLDVKQVERGTSLRDGTVYLPRDEKHVDFRSGSDSVYIRPEDGQPVSGAIPSVDKLFDNASEVFGSEIIAVLLTGMGEDGARGMKRLQKSGALCLGQDKESSTVWGMPGKAAELGALDRQAPAQQIPDIIKEWVRKSLDTPDSTMSAKT
ncbi:MAG: chemotaxis-specific protein-glutamate methyltransferase CheB [bacterium]